MGAPVSFKKAVRFTAFLFAIFLSQLSLAQSQQSTFSPTIPEIPIPAGFTENKGQLAAPDGSPLFDVWFVLDLRTTRIYFTRWGISYFFLRPGPLRSPANSQKRGKFSPQPEQPPFHVEWERVDMILEGATLSHPFAEGRQAASTNYYLAHCPEGIHDVHSWNKLIFKDIYPGIDWEILTGETDGTRGFKQNFRLHPHADPSLIQIRYQGSSEMQMKRSDDKLAILTPLGSITEDRLLGLNEGKEVPVRYTGQANGNLGFEILGSYDPNTVFLIDPRVLTWSTYYGGAFDEKGHSIQSDAISVWVTGQSSSLNLPCQDPAGGAYYQGNNAANYDAFLLEFSVFGVREHATYYGGSGNDIASSLWIDGSSVWITGNTLSTNFPVQNPGAVYYQGTSGGAGDLFIIRMNHAGVRQWATYYGGNGIDYGTSVFSNGATVWLTGYTESSNFPVQNPGGGAYYQAAYGGGQDAFVLKFSTAGVRQWATYYGGDDIDEAHSLHADASNVFIGGYSASTNLPLQNPGGGAYYQNTVDGIDMFLLKFSNGNVRQWATFYGGNDDEMIHSVFTDGLSLWCTGYAVSPDFPLYDPGTGAYFQNTYFGADQAAVVMKFSLSGVRQWVTLYGGNVNSEGNSIFSDRTTVYLAGSSESDNLPVFDPGNGAFFQNHNSNLPTVISESWDLMILEFSSGGVRNWATYYGDVEDDFGNSVWFDGIFLWVAGAAGSDAGLSLVDPGGGAYYQNTCGGCGLYEDALILRFGDFIILSAGNLQLTGENRGDWNFLEWTSSRDPFETDHFEIERKTDPGIFRSIGRVEAKSNPEKFWHYVFEDHQLPEGKAYYRLRQVNIDGSFAYSTVITVERGTEKKKLFVSETAAGQFSLCCDTDPAARIFLFDMQGRMLRELNASSGDRTLIDLRSYSAGIYMLKVVDKLGTQVFRLQKRE